MEAKFLMTTIRPRLSNDEGDSNENGKKNLDGFRLAKQQLCKRITVFFYIS